MTQTQTQTKEETKLMTLIDSRIYNYDYKTYVGYCQDNDIPYDTEDSEDFSSWQVAQMDMDIEDFWEDIKHIEGRFNVNGVLGLWDGIHSFCKTYDTLENAMSECLKYVCDFKVSCNRDMSVFDVYAYHHDGTNKFTMAKIG